VLANGALADGAGDEVLGLAVMEVTVADGGDGLMDGPGLTGDVLSGGAADDPMGAEAITTDTMGEGDVDADDGALGVGAADGRGLSDGLNARPLDDTISQSAPGIPDDSGRPVEVTPEEEARIAQRIRSL
jgi:hypothetical protein